jgi:hypothetical protein
MMEISAGSEIRAGAGTRAGSRIEENVRIGPVSGPETGLG